MPMFFKDSLPLASERQFNIVYTMLTPNNIFTPCKASFLWSRKARDKNVLHITEYNLPSDILIFWPAVTSPPSLYRTHVIPDNVVIYK